MLPVYPTTQAFLTHCPYDQNSLRCISVLCAMFDTTDPSISSSVWLARPVTARQYRAPNAFHTSFRSVMSTDEKLPNPLDNVNPKPYMDKFKVSNNA